MTYLEFKALEETLRLAGYQRYCPDWLQQQLRAIYTNPTLWFTGFRLRDDLTGASLDWQVFIMDLEGVGVVRYEGVPRAN